MVEEYKITQADLDARMAQTPAERHSDDLTAKERLELCGSCEYKTTRMGFDSCKECGCFIYLKAHLKYSRCPLGKWEIQYVPPVGAK